MSYRGLLTTLLLKLCSAEAPNAILYVERNQGPPGARLWLNAWLSTDEDTPKRDLTYKWTITEGAEAAFFRERYDDTPVTYLAFREDAAEGQSVSIRVDVSDGVDSSAAYSSFTVSSEPIPDMESTEPTATTSSPLMETLNVETRKAQGSISGEPPGIVDLRADDAPSVV
eukprot:Gregarina_sp_Poly_1__3598@NODE_2055_length_2752_cov_76_494972_g1325_i0_p1_GENE_NODE_2055_length_2752_cov_76_494972_g1325_i0NODE_2055_length_2752_cov_76_494972_g1325_i0_p1_ORF_typecomplete_len170_score18_81REJ/PF02010_15/1_9e05_NODE_2055_length_2752_cov_76_494972_g1325_i021182627